MSTKMEYNKSFINTIESLVNINEQLVFEHKEGKIKLRANNASNSCLYMLDAPETYFNFSPSTLCMLDYGKFYKFFNVFNNGDKESTEIYLNLNDEGEAVDMRLQSSTRDASLVYRVADLDVVQRPVIKENPNLPPFVAAEWKLSAAQMKEINGMIDLVEAENIGITIENDDCTVTISNKISSNSFTQKYRLESTSDKKVTLNIKPEYFGLVPCENYTVSFSEMGLVKLVQNRKDDINLVLFLSSTK